LPKPSPASGRRATPAPSEPPRREPVVASASHEAVQPGTRRRFTPADKLRLVKAAEAAIASGERGALEALLRQEGIYSSHLSTWRRQFAGGGEAGLAARKPGRKPRLDAAGRALLAVTKENAVLKRKLYIADALIALQKKAHELLGLTLPEQGEDAT
jgi:transposase-like protein